MDPFRIENLANGLTIEFSDRSNRYFGDYWHLDIEARCQFPVSVAMLEADEEELARQFLGDRIEYVRRLERMGVPSGDKESVRATMVADFLATSRVYLEHPEFAARLIRNRLEAAKRPRPPYLIR